MLAALRFLRLRLNVDKLPGCWAVHRLADARWAVVSHDEDPYHPASHVIRIVTEKSFELAAPAIERHQLQLHRHVRPYPIPTTPR
jgi:hypothetical protein